MIRKPPANWQRGESPAVSAVRSVGEVARSGARVASRGGHAARGLFCYFFAALWGFAALASGLTGSLPSLIGIGAMSALMFWAGRRALTKARNIAG